MTVLIDDMFAIQSEVAKAVADQLQAKLSPSERAAIEKPLTTNLAAYELYLRAKALFADTTDTFRSTRSYLKLRACSMKLLPLTRTSSSRGACCPRCIAIAIGMDTTIVRAVSISPTRPYKPRCAFNRIRARLASP